jgi:hypothetical protein
MMSNQYWSWLLSIIGVSGFILAGRKIWWCWYINIACQVLWFTYAVVTEQWGFIVGAIFYTAVFVDNARKWTRDRHKDPREGLAKALKTGSMTSNEVRDSLQ